MNVSKNVNLDGERNVLLHQTGEVKLTEKEKQLLVLLLSCKNANEFARKEDIRHTIWPERHGVVPEGSIVQLVYRLRKVLRYCGLEGCIKTVSREGYRLVVDDAANVVMNEVSKRGAPIYDKKKGFRIRIFLFIFLTLSIFMLSVDFINTFIHCPDGVEIRTQISSHPWVFQSRESCKRTTASNVTQRP